MRMGDKKIRSKLLMIVLMAAMVLCITACGKSEDAGEAAAEASQVSSAGLWSCTRCFLKMHIL